MKKIISLLLVTLLLVVACPTFAADVTPTISISSVTEGDTYAVGASIPLAVDISGATVAVRNIDFYANGIKIPGTATDVTKSVLWTPATSGSYALTATVTTTAGGSLTTANAVNVTVEAENMLFKFDKAEDVSALKFNSTESLTGENANNGFTKVSSYSAKWAIQEDCKYLTLPFDDLALAKSAGARMNFLIYCENDVVDNFAGISLYSSMSYLNPNDAKNRMGYISFKPGWNLITADLTASGSNGTVGYQLSTNAIVKSLLITADNGSTIPTGYINAGTKTNAQTGLYSTTLYLDSVFLTYGSAPAAPAVEKTSIPDDKENVCNQLKKYTITFDQEMNQDTLKDTNNVSVTDASGNPVTVESIATSSNAMVLTFADSSFAYDGTYTVSLNKNIESIYGVSIGEGVAFDFSIVTSCEAADPILTMTYPTSSTTFASNNVTLAAKVIFDGNVSKVEFYKEDNTLIGEAKEGTNGEYYYVSDDFAAGDYSVYAKATLNTTPVSYKDTKDAPVAFTVAEAASYALIGINEGEKIFINSSDTRVLSKTIGLSTTDKVSKVVYKVDGVEKATATQAPFTWEMPITDTNSHAVSAVVYDTVGGINSVAVVNYQAMYINSSLIAGESFDDGTKDASISVGQTGDFFKTKRNDISTHTYVKDPVSNADDDLAVFIDYKNTDSKHNYLAIHNTLPASKQVQVTFDLYTSEAKPQVWVDVDSSTTYSASRTLTVLGACSSAHVYTGDYSVNAGTWNSVTMLLDFNALSYTCILNGQVESSGKFVVETWSNDTFYINFRTLQDYYIDNVYINSLSTMTANEPLVDKVTFTDNGTDWDADFIVTNLSNTASECIIYYAVYGANDKLVSVNFTEAISLPAGAIAQKSIDAISKTNGTETGTYVRGFVWESKNGEATLRPFGTLK